MPSSLPVLDYGTNARPTPRNIARLLLTWLMLAIVGAAVAMAIAYLAAPKPIYRASALLRIQSIPPSIPLPSGTRALTPDEIPAAAQKLRDTLNTTSFRQKILAELKKTPTKAPPKTTDELGQILTITHLSGTTLFTIDAKHQDPTAASEIANIAASTAVREFSGTAPSLNLLSTATVPFAPSNRPKIYLILTGLTGAIVLPVIYWLIRRSRHTAM